MGGTIRIGISSCLLGEKVRYDGGHKLDSLIIEALGETFTLVPVCPEVGCGLPAPREMMRLEGAPDSPRLVAIESRRDLTSMMHDYCDRKVKELAREDIRGFIFKARSPSCGAFGVEVFDNGSPIGTGQGLFAAAVTRCLPRLPVEEEDRLHDPALMEAFIRRVLEYHPCG